MRDKTYNVLFVCTHNSARSILAEGLLNSLGGGRFRADSAGSQPSGTVSPFALKTLATLGIPTEECRSKDWDGFAKPCAPDLDLVFTICDNAAGEVCPVWPGQPMTAHWGVADPSAVQGSDDQKSQAARDTAVILKRRIELMLALPLQTLDKIVLQREVKAIGAR